MWPFRRRRRFADRVLDGMTNIGLGVTKMLSDAYSGGQLSWGELTAMMFPTVGAGKLATTLMTADDSPLRDLKPRDLPDEELAPAGGYKVLLIFQFYNLREIMRNKPEIASIIGVSHAELLSRYAAITGIEERMFTQGMKSHDKIMEDHGGDPMWAELETISDFLGTLTKNPPTPSLVDLYVMLFFERVSD